MNNSISDENFTATGLLIFYLHGTVVTPGDIILSSNLLAETTQIDCLGANEVHNI